MENFLFQDSAPGQLVGESSFNHICIPSTYCQTVCINICYKNGLVHASITCISTVTLMVIQSSSLPTTLIEISLFLFIYLAVPGLSCGMWDLAP